jgi:hypothetical protein
MTALIDPPFTPGSFPYRPGKARDIPPDLASARRSAVLAARSAMLDAGTFHQPSIEDPDELGLADLYWQRPRLAPARPPARVEARKVRVIFGKYKGLTIGQVWAKDRAYVRWLATIGLSPGLRSAIDEFLDRSDSGRRR